MSLLSFSDALDDASGCSTKHLLLGNGFSISCRPNIFAYGKLYEQANFSKVSTTAKFGFDALKTQDFEKVIKALRDASKILQQYSKSSELPKKLVQDADGLREILVQTIASSHPAKPDEISEFEYSSCRQFLEHFDTVYTFNYDLLLYWTKMHTPEGVVPKSDDGFRNPEDDDESPYVVWNANQSRKQDLWFLHGALHIFDSGVEVQKYTWNKTGVRLIDQIREALSKNLFPLFVSEGTSKEKYERIRHSDYLSKAYRSFSSIGGALFVYGHSLAKNDDHYLNCIKKGKVSHLYVGLYGDPNSDANKFIVRRAAQLMDGRSAKYPLTVTYFDAASAKVWGR